ncbi:hydrogen gas-evolving membrane-bound hydrogenase subunit E [Salinispira pacifica]
MIKRLLILVAIALFGLMVWPLVATIAPFSELTPLAARYAEGGTSDLGAANLVTAVVVTYRGLDTLGEVTVLFAATAGVGVLLRRGARSKDELSGATDSEESISDGRQAGHSPFSEILSTGSAALFPLVLMFGAYIFIHGHLTPGGGFQGGVVIASGFALLLAANSGRRLSHGVLLAVESLSGAFYVGLGLLGLVLAAGFLDTTFLPLGRLGQVFSAGAIPIIYSFVGLKVGSELTNILESLRK